MQHMCTVLEQWGDWGMVVEQVNMCILMVLNVMVHVDMVLKVLVSGVMAMEVVVVVNGRMVLEGVEVCWLGTVMVLKKLNFCVV